MGVPYTIVTNWEEGQYEKYCEKFGKHRVIKCPKEYAEKYELLDDHGLSKSTGPGPQRNFAWEHAKSLGYEWHWVMDDNIKTFYYSHKNRQIPINTPLFFRIMENFVLQYENIGMAGPQYFMFVPRKTKKSPLTFNTRIYSCNLIRNDLEQRWRGRYNEDTILSLDILKAGWATVLFNLLLQGKTPTQRIQGGNTATFYNLEGTYAKSKMQEEAHPDVSKVVKKFHRWHHEVDYKPFRRIKLKKKKPEDTPKDALEKYDLILRNKETGEEE